MSIRRHLLPLVVVLVANVCAGLIVTSVAICQSRGPESSAAALVCTCGHGADGQCAMHKHHKMPGSQASPTSPAAPSTQNKWCAGCQDSVDMIVATLTGFAAPIPDPSALTRPDGISPALLASVEQPLELIRPPLSPPPRS